MPQGIDRPRPHPDVELGAQQGDDGHAEHIVALVGDFAQLANVFHSTAATAEATLKDVRHAHGTAPPRRFLPPPDIPRVART
jgi:hypothetical protein